MQFVKITLEFNLNDLMAQNAVNVPAAIALTQLLHEPPPPPNPVMERLRCEFKKIVPRLSGKPQVILEFMLKDINGLATFDDLAEVAWPDEDPSKDCVRQAVHRLKKALIKNGASHVVLGSRKGIYSFAPTPVKDGA